MAKSTMRRFLRVLGIVSVIQFWFAEVALVTATQLDNAACEATVQTWSQMETKNVEADLAQQETHHRLEIQKFLFFLHVPRTGGRTYSDCLLHQMVGPKHWCNSSYDELRIDLSKPNCGFLATHHDYSILSKLPSHEVSVVTSMRHPLHRVLSVYEFAVEVASRFLSDPRLITMTTKIWPWKYLVPMLHQDLFDRREARMGAVEVPSSDLSYDAPSLVMPLKDFINHPMSQELIHNGATFQLAGLTNNSFTEGAETLRNCVGHHPQLGRHILKVAKRRLDAMLFVALTERHQESATMFARAMADHSSIILQPTSVYDKSRLRDFQDTKNESTEEINSDDLTVLKEQQVQELLKKYIACTSRKQQANKSFQALASVNFSSEQRKRLPEQLVEEILALNSLDVELYAHAQSLFAAQKQHFLTASMPDARGRHSASRSKTLGQDAMGDPWKIGHGWLVCLIGLTVTAAFHLRFFCVRRNSPSAGLRKLSKDAHCLPG